MSTGTAGGGWSTDGLGRGHLDSPIEGPGINDNGSGSATALEVALQMAEFGTETRNRVRFTFWGRGRRPDRLTALRRLACERGEGLLMLYLNFDMVGSPNFVRFVYDGDGSAFGTDGPNGFGLDRVGLHGVLLVTESGVGADQFDGRSDYDAFIGAGVPAGGPFTGAEGIKTAAQANIYGGTAGIAYDPCYHQACDTIGNVNETALDEMSDARSRMPRSCTR